MKSGDLDDRLKFSECPFEALRLNRYEFELSRAPGCQHLQGLRDIRFVRFPGGEETTIWYFDYLFRTAAARFVDAVHWADVSAWPAISKPADDSDRLAQC